MNCLQFPLDKTLLLQKAMQEQAGMRRVSVDTIASIVGIWLYGALLDRSLMSIPNNIFQFIHVHRGRVVAWWPSAREELIAMSRAAPLMKHQLDCHLSNLVFATDAQGMGEGDLGGYGIVGSVVSRHDLVHILKRGE